MKKNSFVLILISGIWITLSEFIRNEFLFKSFWVNHFKSLGLNFETLPINGFLWMLWSFCLAFLIGKLYEKFAFWETVFISWVATFILMWVTLFNLQVLPMGILWAALPLSLVEILVATFIFKLGQKNKAILKC